MSDDADTPQLPPDLRFLKLLVTTLMAVMIVGLLTIVGLFVTRLGTAAPLPILPATIDLPQGAVPAAITFARTWLVVVTEDGTILLYHAEGGAPVSSLAAP